jgi:RND family efflux transporter MFP subunit
MPADSVAVPVHVQAVQAVDRPAAATASGSVQARHSSDVAFQVSGQVARVLLEAGDRVRRGQLLATLDPTEYRLSVRSAEADLARARDLSTRTEQLAARLSVAPADIVKANEALRSARAQADVAAKHLRDTELRAPYAGIVGRRLVDPGEEVEPSRAAFTIVDMDPIDVNVGVPSAEIGRVREGQPATVTLITLGGRTVQGRVRVVGVIADSGTRTYPTKILLPNPGYTLRPGMIVEARIQDTTLVRTLTVPGSAIVRDVEGRTVVYVYYPRERRAYAKRVTVGTVTGQMVEITAGLSGQEQIVVGGAQQLRDGALVRIVSDSAPPVSGPSASRGEE